MHGFSSLIRTPQINPVCLEFINIISVKYKDGGEQIKILKKSQLSTTDFFMYDYTLD